ncbi:MAG: hypothetical protein K0R02_897 [Rickettsiaceae bacterium]|jgi:ankyrin repeat protein|nr:hypothetical protein [Rickettsiaceae bacterium]
MKNITELQNVLNRLGFPELEIDSNTVRKPLKKAFNNKDKKAVDVLLDYVEHIDMSIGRDGTPLRYAIKQCNLEIVKLVVARGANINSFYPLWGNTPLSYAASIYGNHEIVEYLLDRGAKLNTDDIGEIYIKDDYGLYKSLQFRANFCNENFNAEAKPQLKNYRCYQKYIPPLHKASSFSEIRNDVKNNIETIKLLIFKGANINEKDFSRNTPLYYALKYPTSNQCYDEKRQGVKILLENGADVKRLADINPNNNYEYDFFSYTIGKTFKKLAHALKDAEYNPGSISLKNILSDNEIQEHNEFIILALKAQLFINTNVLNNDNTINFIKEISPDFGFTEIKQNLLKNGLPEGYNSLNQYIDSLKIKIANQDVLSPNAKDFIDGYNSKLNEFAHDANSLSNLTVTRLFDSVIHGEVSFDEFKLLVNNDQMKMVFNNAFEKGTLVLTQEQMKVKNDLVKFWQEEEILNCSSEATQKDSGIADEAGRAEATEDFLAGTESKLFDDVE